MKIRLFASAAMLALAVSACGSSSDVADDPKDSEPTAAETATEAPTDTPSPTETPADDEAAPPASGDLTPPGTELSIGDWATVPFKYGTDSEGVLRVRVTGVDKGSESDLSVFDEATRNKLKGLSPRYVRIEVEQVSGGVLEYASAQNNFRAITASGNEAQELTAFGSFEPCDSESFPSGWGVGSPAVNICVIGLVASGGDEVVGGRYQQRESEYDSYDGKPVLWK